MIWKIWKKSKLNSEKIWTIWKKIGKRYEKYGRKQLKDKESTEENCEQIWKIWKKGKLNSEMIWKIWKKSKMKCEMK
jgi:hypothetical protein